MTSAEGPEQRAREDIDAALEPWQCCLEIHFSVIPFSKRRVAKRSRRSFAVWLSICATSQTQRSSSLQPFAPVKILAQSVWAHVSVNAARRSGAAMLSGIGPLLSF